MEEPTAFEPQEPVNAPTLDRSDFTYDTNAPVEGVRTGAPPPQVINEESMLGALIQYDNPSMDMVQSIQKQYQIEGASSLVEGIKMKEADEANQRAAQTEYNKYATGEESLQQLETSLATTRAKNADDFGDLHQQYLRTQLFRNAATTPEEIQVQEDKIEQLVLEGYSHEQAIADRVQWLIGNMHSDLPSAAGGLGAELLPFATTVPWIRAFKKVFPDQDFGANPLDYARGEIAVDFRNRMEALSPEDQYSVANDFIDAVMEEDGLLTGTQFQKIMILDEALGTSFGTVDRVVLDIVSLLDTIMVGSMAKNLIKGFGKLFKPGSVLSTVSLADQRQAQRLAANAIKKDMQAQVGMTQAELVELAVTPGKFKSNIELLPPNIIKALTETDKRVLDLVQRTRNNPLAVTAQEQAEIARNFRNEVKQVGNSGAYGSSYTARRTDEGLEYTASYGRITSDGTTIPYASAADAIEGAAHNFPGSTVRVLKRNPKGNLVEVNPLTPKTGVPSKKAGEFVYEVDGFKSYAEVAGVSENVGFKKGDILFSGVSAKYIADPASRFAGWISRAFGQAGDVERGITHELHQMMRPLADLKINKQRDVVMLLQKYAKDAPNMDTAKIIAAAKGDTEVLGGFFAYRQVMDVLWELENRNLYKDLTRQGTKHLVIGEYQNMGVQVGKANLFQMASETGKNSIEVFDAVKGRMIQLNEKQISKLHADGKSIYRTTEPAGDLTRQSNLVIVNSPDVVRELPRAVLKKIDGYIPRFYKDTYFVQKNTKGTMNGKAGFNSTILRAVGDKAEANQVVKQLLAEGKLTAKEAETAIRHDRTLTPSQRTTLNTQDNTQLGRMFYHKRNKTRLQGIDGLAEVLDPLESVMRNIQSTSKYVANVDLIDGMKARWMNTFGKEANLIDGVKGFPTNKSEIGGRDLLTESQKADAIEMWEHIRTTESLSTWEGELWRDKFMSIADGVIGTSTQANLFQKGVSAGAKNLAESSINKKLRKLAFELLITWNPVRQIVIQSQQFTALAALMPKKIGTVWSRGWAVRHGMLKETSPMMYKMFKDRAAKTMGMSTKQYDEYMKMFDDTGLGHSVNSHDYVAKITEEYSSNLTQGRLGQAKDSVIKATGLPWLRAQAKAKGFDHGELINLTSTWAAAEQRYFARTGKKILKSKKDFAEVGADARQLALDMTHTGALRYQNGGLSALTQFLSIQHKMLLAMNPLDTKAFANHAFTVQERRKILVGQLLLNGTKGLGLHKMYREARDHLGLDLPEEVEMVVVGGMADLLVNQAIDLASDTDGSNLNISGNTAAASDILEKGVDLYDVIAGNKNFTEMAAATNVIGRVYDMAKTAKAMFDYTALETDEAILAHIANFSSITSGMNQALRARAGARLGHHVANSGNPTVQASFSSLLAEGLFGIQQNNLEEFYDLQDDFGNEMMNTTGAFDIDKETSEVAKHLYKQMTRVVTLFESEFDGDLEGESTDHLYKLHMQRMRTAMGMHAEILANYDPVERDRIWQKFQNMSITDRTHNSDALVDKIVRMIMAGDLADQPVLPFLTSDTEHTIRRLRASGLYDPTSAKGKQLEQATRQLQENLTMQNRLSDQNLETLQNMESK